MKFRIKRIAALAAAFIIIISALVSPASSAADISMHAGSEAYAMASAVAHTSSAESGELKLYPGGMPFGVKFYTEGVLVVGFCDIETEGGKVNPAYAAGIRIKDVITAVGGEPLNDAAELTTKIDKSEGKPVDVTYRRDGEAHTVTLTPVYSQSEGRYKTGVWVRDSGAGIGTVTFIVPSSGAFGGLGHGICDGDTGELTPMRRGNVTSVTISGLTRGIAGDPGEVKGYFNSGKCGTLLGNTENGVYGIFTDLPSTPPEEAMKIATRSEVKEGEAYIWCTLDSNEACRYTVELSAIDRDSDSNKCFTVTITDPVLLEKTGGIIQGMSGSPIIQNGKLVGAVTHVLINDPSRGYGIFIENMLDSMPELLR
ncbi:MAG: SpoIVB peptidase [Clostridia bacterium]|nr:SpoIVB peptidase [Clostridia bacterium]